MILLHLSCYTQVYPYKQFTTKDGLINNRCGNVSQDSAGYIWITSDNGISNYDGRKFTFFPGKNSTYYFAHTNTINIYKGQCVFATSGEGFAVGFANKLTFHSLPDGPVNQIMYGLQLNDTSTLIAKIYAIDLELIVGNRIMILKPPIEIAKKMKSFLMFHKDIEGNIWIGTDAGVYVYSKGHFNDPYIVPDLFSKYCAVLKSDFEGNIFVAVDKTVYKIFKQHLNNIKNAKPVKFATHKADITAMGFARNGDILVSDLPFGVAVYNKSLQFVNELSKHGLPDVVLWDIFVDREDNIWFATENGVYRFANFNFINYIPQNVNGAPNIRNGVVYKGTFLFSTGKDVFTIKNESIKKIYGTQLMNNYDVRILVSPNDEIWINKNISNGVTPIRATLAGSIVNNTMLLNRTIIFNNDNNSIVDVSNAVAINISEMVFLNRKKELYYYGNKKINKIKLPPPIDAIQINTISKGTNDNEIVLVANTIGFYKCIIQSDSDDVRLTVVEKTEFTKEEKYDKCIKILVTKNKNIWLATQNNGIRIYSKKNNKYALFTTLTEPEISSSLITELMEDSGGNIWVGSNKGIDRVSTQQQVNFSISKGLYSNLMNGSLIYFLKEYNKKLYIGTTGSLSTVDIDAKLTSTVPLVHISHLLVNNNNADSLLSQTSYTFSPNQNNLTFEFVSPTYINEQVTQYQYQLVGVDKDWSVPGSNYIVVYNQLPAGKYTFRVRAKNANGVWSLTDAVFTFSINIPFYKHWLFIVLCIGIFGVLLYWLYIQKMNKIIAVESTRRSISKDLHDDIGTTLSSITLMNAVLKNKITTNPAEAEKMADKIESTSRGMIQNMSDIVWSINPNNDTIDKIVYRLQQFSNDIFEDKKISFNITIDESIKQKTLSMQLRKDIYLICKELITNAAKYSKAQKFTLTLLIKQSQLNITAIDDGIGFDAQLVKMGNGLHNIKQRTVMHNGTASVIMYNGTSWNIVIPV